jgi:glycosyltransferase involved in cell wall biosynthesis
MTLCFESFFATPAFGDCPKQNPFVAELSSTRQLDIAQVVGALAPGGAEHFVVDLASRLASHDWKVSVLALSRRGDATESALRARLERHGISVFLGPSLRVRMQTARWHGETLSALDPRIVHLHTPNTYLAHLLACPWHRFHAAIIRTIHTTKVRRLSPEHLASLILPFRFSVACGQAAFEAHQSYTHGPLRVIVNGVDFRWPPRNDSRVQLLRRELQLTEANRHFLAVGSMKGSHPETAAKAHDVMIHAWKLLERDHSNVELHFLGDGPLREPLQAMARGSHTIRFHGNRPDIHLWLGAADCFLMPSRWEGLPIAAVEALGTGIPAIFSDIPPLRELKRQGVVYVVPGSPNSLAAAIRGFVNQPFPPPTPQDIVLFRERFGIERAAREYEEIYSSLASR